MPMKRLFYPIVRMLCIYQIALADKLCSLNRGTLSIMYQELACISNALYAWSHLSHTGPSAPGLPLFCQSVEQLKRDLSNTSAGITGSGSPCEGGLCGKCASGSY